MYKVFLVDDEELVIKSLEASVNWRDYGFEVVDYALSGREAYEKIQDLKPDVVFTDIRMPGMSGLELIKSIKQATVDTIFIVVSGYAEFAYAQKAMNYGALGYCLKPFDDDEIISFLKKVRTILDGTRTSNETEIMDLIEENNKNAKESLRRKLLKFGIEISQNKRLRVIVSIGKSKLKFDRITAVLTLKIGYDKYAYFILESGSVNLNRHRDWITTEGIKGVGISREIDKEEHIKEAINEAEIRAYNYFTSPKGNALSYDLTSFRDKDNSIKKLEEAISRNDIPSIVKLLESIGELFENGKLNIKQAIIIHNHVMEFAYRFKNEQYEDYIYSFEKLAQLFYNVQEMLLFLKRLLLEELNIKYEFTPQKVMNHTFKSIFGFVNENFCSDISTQSISRDFNVNANYISQLFKKEVGITFTEYLSKLRIDYACSLLKTTDIPISEIAEKVGYEDYFYFSRVFKKIKGKSPSSFKMDIS